LQPTARSAIIEIVFQMDISALTASPTKLAAFKQNFTNQFLAANSQFGKSQISVMITYRSETGVASFAVEGHHSMRRALASSPVTITITVLNPSPTQQTTLAQVTAASFQTILEQALPSLGLTSAQIAIIMQTVSVTVQVSPTLTTPRPSFPPTRKPGIATSKITAAPTTHPDAGFQNVLTPKNPKAGAGDRFQLSSLKVTLFSLSFSLMVLVF